MTTMVRPGATLVMTDGELAVVVVPDDAPVVVVALEDPPELATLASVPVR